MNFKYWAMSQSSFWFFILVQLFPEDNEAGSASSSVCTWRYYLLPCLLLFDRNMPVLKHLICKMESMIAESCELLILRDNPAKQDHLRRIQAATRVFSMLSMDARMRTVLSLYKGEIDSISQRLHEIQVCKPGYSLHLLTSFCLHRNYPPPCRKWYQIRMRRHLLYICWYVCYLDSSFHLKYLCWTIKYWLLQHG